MTTVSTRPPQFAWVTPYITVKNIDDIVLFYEKAFGFILKEKMPDQDSNMTVHAEMIYQDQVLMFGREGAYNGITKAPNTLGIESPINLYIYCQNIEKLYQQAVGAGAVSLTAPEDTFWGDRMCRLKCPEGYIWAFAVYSGVCQQAK